MKSVINTRHVHLRAIFFQQKQAYREKNVVYRINIAGKWYIVSNEAIFLYVKKKLDTLAVEDPAKTYTALNEDVLKIPLKDAVPAIASDEQMKNLCK